MRGPVSLGSEPESVEIGADLLPALEQSPRRRLHESSRPRRATTFAAGGSSPTHDPATGHQAGAPSRSFNAKILDIDAVT
jgi:hypothetical protein